MNAGAAADRGPTVGVRNRDLVGDDGHRGVRQQFHGVTEGVAVRVISVVQPLIIEIGTKEVVRLPVVLTGTKVRLMGGDEVAGDVCCLGGFPHRFGAGHPVRVPALRVVPPADQSAVAWASPRSAAPTTAACRVRLNCPSNSSSDIARCCVMSTSMVVVGSRGPSTLVVM